MLKMLSMLSLTSLVIGANITINVSQGFSYNPQSVNANVGDTITWIFSSTHHTVTEGLACVSNKGFDSGIQNTGTFKYTITPDREDTTINYFCRVGSHCLQGMTGGISVKTGVISSSNSETNIVSDDMMLLLIIFVSAF